MTSLPEIRRCLPPDRFDGLQSVTFTLRAYARRYPGMSWLGDGFTTRESATHPEELVDLLSAKGAGGWSLILQGQTARAIKAELVATCKPDLHGGIEADSALGAGHGAAGAASADAPFVTSATGFRVLGFVILFKRIGFDHRVWCVEHASRRGERVVHRPKPATPKRCQLGETALAVYSNQRSPHRCNHM